jgi:ubiquinol-cytochrome c reductase cytochrome c subunit
VKLIALVVALGALVVVASAGHAQRAPDAAHGRQLYVLGCSSCHGMDARGVPGRGPSLRRAGALAADFYLRTGRMPLGDPGDEPVRTRPAYDDADIADLVAYVGSLGGPPVPVVARAPARVLSRGKKLFTDNCAGCHTSLARGGIVTGGIAPPLQDAGDVQVAEAIRLGPFLMPRFSARQLPRSDVEAIAAYVRSTRHPRNAGGWGIGGIGPVPEGMVAWFLGLFSLVLVARLVGER